MTRRFEEPELVGKVALITGGGSGIGRALALALSAAGAEVWITGRRLEPLEETAALGDGQIHCSVVDVRDRDRIASLAATIRSSSGALDLLVNNAAILGPTGTLEGINPSEVEAVWDINIHGLYLTSWAMLPLLKGARSGACIINLSSGVGRRGRAGWGPYAASKFAVEGLTQCWAEELEDSGVRVYALNPGGTATAMRAQAKPDEDPSTIPQPDDILPAFFYLLSETAREQEVPGASIDARDFLS